MVIEVICFTTSGELRRSITLLCTRSSNRSHVLVPAKINSEFDYLQNTFSAKLSKCVSKPENHFICKRIACIKVRSVTPRHGRSNHISVRGISKNNLRITRFVHLNTKLRTILDCASVLKCSLYENFIEKLKFQINFPVVICTVKFM